ncbi:MAG: DUF479 domain-containing protein [Azonexaceae bacterium]|nr:DUF479 domain-containing protein [Azonexaceae bacterium]
MNFLAHAVLAEQDPALIVGGVIGDWIKGPLPAALPPDLARGVALHRAIDSHAESHPAFQRSRQRISPARRRYAGVLIDIFYDHLLARDWPGPPHLADYCAGIYRHIATRATDLPAHVAPAMSLMAEEDWLASYAAIDGMRDVLQRMSQRARQPNPLAGGMDEFTVDPQSFAEDFADWYGDAQAFVSDWCRLRPPSGR